MNNKITGFTIGALVIAVIVLGIGLAVGKPVVKVEVPLGASSGPDHYNTEIFHSGIMIGGSIRATSTNDTTATFLANDIIDRSIVNFTPNVTSITATLPATSTLRGFIKAEGASHTFFICNATSTVDYFTLAAGTGMNLHQATSSMTIMNGDCSEITLIRNSDTDMELMYQEGY